MKNSSEELTSTQRVYLLCVSFVSLLFFAAIVNIVFVSLIHVSRSYQLEEGALGMLYLLEFLGFYIAVLLGGYISDKYGKKYPLIIGSVLMAVGAGGFSCSQGLAGGTVFLFLFGAGGGLVEGVGVALVGDLYRSNPQNMVNLSQAFYGIGAVGGPTLAGYALGQGAEWRTLFVFLSLLVCPLILAYWAARFPTPPNSEKVSVRRAFTIIRDNRFIVLNLTMFLYVGGEMGVASWVCVFLAKTLGITVTRYGLVLAVFWLGIIAGRLLRAALPRFISDRTLILFSLGAGIVFQAFAFAAGSFYAMVAVYLLVGLSLACVWPAIICMVSKHFPDHPSTAICITVGSGGLGAFVFPFLLGQAALRFGIRSAMVGPIILTTLSLLLFFLCFRPKVSAPR